MNDVPIFDSLTHPTPNGRWIGCGSSDADITELSKQMASSSVEHAFAVGLGVGGYDETTYAAWIRRHLPNAFPIAYFDVHQHKRCGTNLTQRMADIRDKGYSGIKLHPRFGRFNFSHPLLPGIIRTAHEHNLLTLICTYPYSPESDPRLLGLEAFLDLLRTLENPRMILLHGGLSRVLEWSEAIRPWSNLLLDLSFTMLRYRGSSLDQDIGCLFRNFDQRICIGSDHPQYRPSQLREHFEILSDGLPIRKKTNIAFNNIARLLGSI